MCVCPEGLFVNFNRNLNLNTKPKNNKFTKPFQEKFMTNFKELFFLQTQDKTKQRKSKHVHFISAVRGKILEL